jgi:hypothetical protein
MKGKKQGLFEKSRRISRRERADLDDRDGARGARDDDTEGQDREENGELHAGRDSTRAIPAVLALAARLGPPHNPASLAPRVLYQISATTRRR